MTPEDQRIIGVGTTSELLTMRDAMNRLIGRFDEIEKARDDAREENVRWREHIEGRLDDVGRHLAACPLTTEHAIRKAVADCRASREKETEAAITYANERMAVKRWGVSWREWLMAAFALVSIAVAVAQSLT